MTSKLKFPKSRLLYTEVSEQDSDTELDYNLDNYDWGLVTIFFFLAFHCGHTENQLSNCIKIMNKYLLTVKNILFLSYVQFWLGIMIPHNLHSSDIYRLGILKSVGSVLLVAPQTHSPPQKMYKSLKWLLDFPTLLSTAAHPPPKGYKSPRATLRLYSIEDGGPYRSCRTTQSCGLRPCYQG